MIPREVIEEVKARNPIEDVISGYVTLKRAGSNMNGLCPFHSEKTPSFTVFIGTSSFHCFGCGVGGDVISFVMRAENLDYPAAVEFLAGRAGITIPKDAGATADESKRRSRTLQINRDAARFFHSILYSDAGRPGYVYLKEKRKLSDGVIRHFGLGYAPEGFGALTDHLKKLGYTEKEMVDAFLCGVSKKTGKPYDYFRGRVMFPIIDVAGNVIAFGGRVLDDSKPKYLNSSDTPAFKKSKNLFALNFARRHCEEQMILCEGYMDVIALHAAGFPNAVATLGTAITPDHARMFKRYTRSVVISYDSDAAGQRAAERAFTLLSEVGVDTKILKMDGAKDPDEYIARFGAARFKQLLSEGKSRFDFTFDRVLAKYDVTTADGRIRAAKEMVSVLAGVYSDVERDVYTHRVADKLSIAFDSLRSDIGRTVRKARSEAKKEEMRQVVRRTEGYADRVNPDYIKNVRAARSEESILGILLARPDLIPYAAEHLRAEEFFTVFGKKAYEALTRLGGDGDFEFGQMNEQFSGDEIGRLQQIRLARQDLGNDRTVLDECVTTLRDAQKNKDQDISDIIEAKRRKKHE